MIAASTSDPFTSAASGNEPATINKMKQEQLNEVIAKHAQWLADPATGERANLSRANLSRANLSGAYLSEANLSEANLSRAYLSEANLSEANLSRANLSGANLSGANLSRANLTDARFPHFQIPAGDLVVFKKLSNGTICKLRIPTEAKRTASLVGRKCRAEFAVVLEGSGASSHDRRIKYEVGETVTPDAYDDDIRIECAAGIHFFCTRQEAEEY